MSFNLIEGKTQIAGDDGTKVGVDSENRLKVVMDYTGTILGLEDTPSVYDEDKYLQSTASGTQWQTISGDHDTLNNLDYDSAGHTGFASTEDLSTTSGVLQDQITQSAGYSTTTYYLHEDSADIGGYELLRSTPAEDPESYDSTSIVAGDGETAMDMYVTTSGEPNTTAIVAGTWTWVLWASVSAVSQGPHYLRAKWYRREQGGSEHYLFTQEQQITNIAQTRYFIETSSSGIDMATTDRLVVKLYAQTTAVSSRTIGYYVEGVDHPTRFNTPVYTSLITSHIDLTGLDYASAGHTGFASTADLTSHTGTTNIHTVLSDTTSGTNNVWSADKIIDYADSVVDGAGQLGKYALGSGVTTGTIGFVTNFDDVSYNVNATLTNLIDDVVSLYGVIITATTVSGFDFELTGETDSSNYVLNWQAQDTIGDVIGYTVLNATPNDQTGSGDIANMQVDESSAGFGNALHMDTDGNWIDAAADAIETMPCTALALEGGTGVINVLMRGFITNTDWDWTPGATIYVAVIPGVLTETAPSGTGEFVQIAGVATHADRMWFMPTYNLVEVD